MQGVRIKVDKTGDLNVRRESPNCPAFVHGTNQPDAFCFSKDLVKRKGRLEFKQPAKVFDMRKFKREIEQESQNNSVSAKSRHKMMLKTAIALSFVREDVQLLNTPCWFLVINLIALDMLNNRIPLTLSTSKKTNFIYRI